MDNKRVLLYTMIAIKSQNYIDKNSLFILFFNTFRVIVSAAAANAAIQCVFFYY